MYAFISELIYEIFRNLCESQKWLRIVKLQTLRARSAFISELIYEIFRNLCESQKWLRIVKLQTLRARSAFISELIYEIFRNLCESQKWLRIVKLQTLRAISPFKFLSSYELPFNITSWTGRGWFGFESNNHFVVSDVNSLSLMITNCTNVPLRSITQMESETTDIVIIVDGYCCDPFAV